MSFSVIYLIVILAGQSYSVGPLDHTMDECMVIAQAPSGAVVKMRDGGELVLAVQTDHAVCVESTN